MESKRYASFLQIVSLILIISEMSCVKLKKLRYLDSVQSKITIEYRAPGTPQIINEAFKDKPDIISYKGKNYTMKEFKSLNLANETENLDLIWNNKLTNMVEMFKDTKNLLKADLSEFDSSEVTDMKGLFNGCENLTSLNLSNLNTYKVKNMSGIFKSCYSLTSLDLSNFNTSNLEDMSEMFYGCNFLSSLVPSRPFPVGSIPSRVRTSRPTSRPSPSLRGVQGHARESLPVERSHRGAAGEVP